MACIEVEESLANKNYKTKLKTHGIFENYNTTFITLNSNKVYDKKFPRVL